MTFDSLTLCAVAAELGAAAKHRRLGAVVLPDRDTLTIGLPEGALLLSIDARMARAHLVANLPRPLAGSRSGVADQLDTLLRGATLTCVRVVDFDRVLHLECETLDRVGRPRRYRVVGEFMGKHSACCVTDEEDVIVAVLRPVTRAVNRYRELLPRRPYVPPPAGGRRDPLCMERDELRAAWPELAAAPSLREGWRARWFGLSDLLWRWLCSRAGCPETVTGATADPSLPDRLWEAWNEVRECVDRAAYEPCLVRDAAGLPETAWPLMLPGAEPIQSISDGLTQCAEHELARRARDENRSRLAADLALARRRVEQRLEDRARRAERARRADEWQAQADLILANLHRIPPRATELIVPDWPEPGAQTTVPLDPARPGAQQAAGLYERARKARQAAAADREDERVEDELERLEALAQAVATAPDAAALAKLEPVVRAAVGQLVPSPPRPGGPTRRYLHRLLTRTSTDGYTILVGRNSAESEFLLSRLAAPTDWWLHVRGAGSGHVIVRSEGRPEAVPPRTIEEAARLAARHSQMKHSALVPVVYTLRKYVTKVRGGAAGKVVYRREKTIFVAPAE